MLNENKINRIRCLLHCRLAFIVLRSLGSCTEARYYKVRNTLQPWTNAKYHGVTIIVIKFMLFSNSKKAMQEYDRKDESCANYIVFRSHCPNLSVRTCIAIKFIIFSFPFLDWTDDCVFLLYAFLYTLWTQDT